MIPIWRFVGLAVGALALQASADAADPRFVSTSGRHLVLNQKPFYVHGASQYYLFFKPQEMVDEILHDAVALGLNVMRTWAFCEGTGQEGFCFQPKPRVYDEATFRKLDYVIYRAGQLKLKLVLPLVNNWDDFGGMNQYVAWCGSTDGHDEFYRNACAKALYKDYVRYVLTRVNTYTGVAYRDDPAIMMWELANEPRCESDPTGNTLLAWVQEMAGFVKSLDPNHLVSTGEEGWYVNKGTDWRHNGSKGADFIRNSQVSSVDVASFRLYPHVYALNESESLGWIDEHVDDAHHVIRKPVSLGEFGWKVPRAVIGDFSVGAETWKVEWGYRASSPERVVSPSQNGNGAIAYWPATLLPAGGTAAGERVFPDPGIDLRSTDTITAWVYLPAEAPADMQAALYTKSGADWIWREGNLSSLARDTWTPVILSTSAVHQPGQVRSVGIKVFNGTTGYAGPIYYDVVTASSTAAGQTMADRNRVSGDWYKRLDARDIDSALFWILVGHQENTTLFPDFDHYAVYVPEDAETSEVIRAYATIIANKNAAPADGPPAVSIQAPQQQATVSGLVTIRAIATDDHGVSAVAYAVDGGAERSLVLASGVWTAVWDSTTIQDGTHMVTVVATDTIGQTGQARVEVTVRNSTFEPPAVDIQANGANGPIVLKPKDSLSLTVALDPRSAVGYPADWWAAAVTPWGIYWVTPQGWVRSDIPLRAYAGPLANLAPLEILKAGPPLPQGQFAFYFAVDGVMDGIPNAPIYIDGVQIAIPITTGSVRTTGPRQSSLFWDSRYRFTLKGRR